MAPPPPAEVRWGLPDAAAGWAAALVLSAVFGAVALGAGGWDTFDDVPIWALALLQLPLWAGLVGAVVYASRRRGAGSLAVDFGVRVVPRDVPIGLAIGVAAQFFVNWVVAWPFLELTGTSRDDYEEPARKLADTAHASSWWGVALFVVMVVVGAPLVEELFYRGLLQRACRRAVERSVLRPWAPAVAISVTAFAFGLAHFQVLQLPSLVVFGLILGVLAHRSGRLGPAWAAHVGFNATAAVTLIWQAAHA